MTGMGEIASDFLAHRFGPLAAVRLAGQGLLVALTAQFAVRRFQVGIFLTRAAMVSALATLPAGVVQVGLGVHCLISAGIFSVALAVILVLWRRAEVTLSIPGIFTLRQELFSWATVLAPLTLGDLTARALELGGFGSALPFAGLMLVPALPGARVGLGEVVACWWACVLARPLGTSLAGWMTVPLNQSGLRQRAGQVGLGGADRLPGRVPGVQPARCDHRAPSA